MCISWLKRNLSLEATRATIAKNKWLRPLHDNPVFWEINEYSVSMGVAIGVFVGCLPILMQMLLAGLIAIPFRANVPISILFTWANNPFTIVPINYAMYRIGSLFIHTEYAPGAKELNINLNFSSIIGFWDSLSLWMQHFGKAYLMGVPFVATGLSVLSYFLAKIFYRMILAKKSKKYKKI